MSQRSPRPEQEAMKKWWYATLTGKLLVQTLFLTAHPPLPKIHGIVILFWTSSYISTALWAISADTVQISCESGSTNICISLLFPPHHLRAFFTEEPRPDLGWKLKLESSIGGGKARSMEGIISQDPELPLMRTLGSGAHSSPRVNVEVLGFFLLFSFPVVPQKMCKLWLLASGVISLFKGKCKVFSH